MSVARDAVYGLYGAARLARFDRDGTRWFDGSPEAAFRSFWAYAAILPAHWLLLALFSPDLAARVGLATVLAVETPVYVVKVVAYLLVVQRIAEAHDNAARVAGFVAAYNWAGILQMGAYLLVVLIGEAGLLPESVATGLTLIVVFWAAALGWFIARHMLDATPMGALALVVLEIVMAGLFDAGVDGLVWNKG